MKVGDKLKLRDSNGVLEVVSVCDDGNIVCELSNPMPEIKPGYAIVVMIENTPARRCGIAKTEGDFILVWDGPFMPVKIHKSSKQIQSLLDNDGKILWVNV